MRWANHANDSYSFDGSYYMQVGSDENGTSGASLCPDSSCGCQDMLPRFLLRAVFRLGGCPEGEERIYFWDSSAMYWMKPSDVAATL